MRFGRIVAWKKFRASRLVLDDAEGSSRAAKPGFRDLLNDRQIVGLVRYARERFAAQKPAWDGIQERVARLRPRATN